MPTYTITAQDRYTVEADSPEQAIASFRVSFDGIEPELFDLKPEEVIDQDSFEYLDGEVKAEED
jgi:hypothetical protein